MKIKNLLALIAALGGLSGVQAAEPVITDPNSTSLGLVKGADPGEGLDLDGNIVYALSFGTLTFGPDAVDSLKIRDATFRGLLVDEVPGANLNAQNTIANWYRVDYGESPDDDNLEFATSSIRWSAAPAVVTLTLDNLKIGAAYKMQLMFGEQCCNRGFNVLVDGNIIVKDFNPGVQHEGIANGTQEALITHTFLATKTSVVIVLDGPSSSPDYSDHNAIFNALTLEETGAAGDTDGDGLADAWEQLYFTNLSATPAGDPDGDGLTNAEELAAGSDPTKADTDGDTLSDSAEVKTHKTDPKKADSDGDGLSDSEEILTYKSDPLKSDSDGDLLADAVEVKTFGTDPAKADTDGDGYSDYAEIHLLGDPKNSASKPRRTTVNLFTGPDPGEGLDFTGVFPYAISFGNETQGGQVYDALFTPDSAPGITVAASQVANNWNIGVDYGPSDAEQVLSTVIQNIRWSDAGNANIPDVTVTLDNLRVGGTYKLQLLFGERLWARGFNISINGKLVAKEFAPFQWQGGFVGPGGATPRTNGVVLTYSFISPSSSLVFNLDGRPVTDPAMPDHNAIINGATLELVAPPADSDGDGLWDAWEMEAFGNLAQNSSGDPDNDGLTNAQEFIADTDPTKADTDGDGLADGQEINTIKSDPLKPDSDGDGLTDGDEVNTHHTNPNKRDSDDDNWSDADEINVRKTNPNKSETGATVWGVTGGDIGEGLDLDGKFIYAFSIGTESGAGQIRDAVFTGQTVDGVSIAGAPNVIENWYQADFGDTPNDDSLELAISSIRHGGGGAVITLSNLVVGTQYKLQLMFGEQCCARGMDVLVDGYLIVDEFAPFVIQERIANRRKAAVITYPFFAKKNTVVIQTTGATVTTARYTDRNPIINAVTLEEVVKFADTDNDGLPDEWERLNFGNLNQTSAGDPDNDTISNALEYRMGSDPNASEPGRDSDGDGLADLDEINIYKTDPAKTDSDGDGLPDGLEVVTTGPATRISNVVIQAFSGGDPGEGLDLQGRFRYAVNVSSAGAAGQAGDANFTADNVPGVVVIAPNNIPNWDSPAYGDSPADNVIEKVTQSIRYGSTVRVVLDVVPGSTYKLQTLFYEQCCGNRGFNIYVDGELVAADFSPPTVQGGVNNTAAGAVVAAEVQTQRNKMSLVFTTFGRTDPALTDPNAILDGFTLEAINEILPPSLSLSVGANGQLTITTDSTLQSADAVTGPYQSLPDKTITVNPKSAGQQKFYRATRP